MSANKYEEIAQAAIRLFQQKGYHATSVQDIADEVGLQKGSLYHYISSKEELLMKIAHQSISGFNRRLEKIIDMEVNHREKLFMAVQTHITVVAANMQMTTVLLREAFSLAEPHATIIQELTDRYLDLWTRIIDEGIAAGEFKPGNSRLKALAILGACNWLYRWYETDGPLSADEISKVFADIFLDGVAYHKPGGSIPPS
ncbi:TetR family transcriptional regulator [Collibacillus ludicampi]|jgi:AcrR family transcriptional regulator|uniref:TetR family transcriptional regulator n=1 Tax=Collibacillus ludicampi TaxID=2771369 RepID=A0AAV4LE08_9BACL|nr:TetR/AcrR family transcriptional regulator [Collibacillus ludicampi]GIM46085.1 TetR family transcriptional regulator [Collibacillus ludicampi]